MCFLSFLFSLDLCSFKLIKSSCSSPSVTCLMKCHILCVCVFLTWHDIRCFWRVYWDLHLKYILYFLNNCCKGLNNVWMCQTLNAHTHTRTHTQIDTRPTLRNLAFGGSERQIELRMFRIYDAKRETRGTSQLLFRLAATSDRELYSQGIRADCS